MSYLKTTFITGDQSDDDTATADRMGLAQDWGRLWATVDHPAWGGEGMQGADYIHDTYILMSPLNTSR